MISADEITGLGEQLLTMNPDVVPKFLILRDVLKLSPEDTQYRKAKSDMTGSRWIRELAEEQQDNGSFGRFHTQDTKIKQKIPTTEWAITRGLGLGLSKTDEIIRKTIQHMEHLLNGKELPLDNEEHHYGFRIAFAYIIASNLAKIDPMHPLLAPKRQACAECVRRAFQSGSFIEEDWKLACRELNEVMLNLYMIHPLTILQSGNESNLSVELERKLLQWIWNRPEGIYYITDQCPGVYQDVNSGQFHQWLHGIELLSDFQLWPEFVSDAVEHLLCQREGDGLWEYGPKANQNPFVHYSESWRNKNNRKIDCSVRILALLRKYADKRTV
jgi:hypothetical protein